LPSRSRGIFKALSGASTAVLIAAVAVWARSYWALDTYECSSRSDDRGGRTLIVSNSISWGGGALALRRIRLLYAPESLQQPQITKDMAWQSYQRTKGWRSTDATLPLGAWRNRGRFDYQSEYDVQSNLYPRNSSKVLVFPIWAICILASVLPLCWMRGALKSRRGVRRLKLGQCVHCGYDLRASTGRCPECGAAPAIKRAST